MSQRALPTGCLSPSGNDCREDDLQTETTAPNVPESDLLLPPYYIQRNLYKDNEGCVGPSSFEDIPFLIGDTDHATLAYTPSPPFPVYETMLARAKGVLATDVFGCNGFALRLELS